MPNFNKVILMGNLTRDPEMRYTPKGTAVAQISLAINRTWKDPESGEAKEEVTFVDVDAFGRQAEVISQYLKKGRPIMVEGRLKLDTWEDKNTKEKRRRMSVVLEGFQFLDSGQAREGGSGFSGGASGPRENARESSGGYQNAPRPSSPPRAPSAPPAHSEPEGPGAEEDDVPF